MSRRNNLIKYSASRLALVPLMLWIISSLVFLLLRVAPGDPVDAILGNRATENARAALRERLGLDLPIWKQYCQYLNGILHGNLGETLINQESVSKIIGRSLPASIELGVCALLIALLIGGLVGFSSIARPQSKLDLSARVYGIATYALPPFWAAMLIQLVFAVSLGWLPVGGRFPPSLPPPSGSGFLILDSILNMNWIALQAAIIHLILPASTLGILLSGIFSRSLRINLERSLEADHIEAARSRGLPERQVILKHALPNALLPVLTIAGITVASLIGGALLIEITFSWPGLAMRLQEAIGQRDYPLVQGIVVVVSTLVVLVTIAVDLIVAAIDPRVRY